MFLCWDIRIEKYPELSFPRSLSRRTKNEYQIALFELVSKANDTHGNLWSSLDARPPVRKCALPVTLRFAEGRNVVEVPGRNIRK
jgi:hypothetical protein